MSALNRLGLAIPFAVFLGVYGTSIGRGFVADDFLWILDSRIEHASQVPALFQRSTGFYRPVVGLTFAADYAAFGTNPLGYGLTNLALAAACAVLLYLIARQLALPPGAALFAAALWLMNPHGMNTAILWMSGRTALMLSLGALGAVLLLLRGHPFAALAPAAVALFSKEEGVLLPIVLFGWWVLMDPEGASRRRRVLWVCAAAGLLSAYFVLRFQTSAMTPWTAPPYYRFTANPRVLWKNVWEYSDRALTFSLAAAALGAILLRPAAPAPRISRRLLACCALWVIAGYGLTVFLPVRSSLYATFPSAGGCLFATHLVWRRWTAATPATRRLAAVTGIVAAVAMTPIYRMRNATTIDNARFSSTILSELDRATAGVPDGETVVVFDERRRRPNIETAFNTALEDGFELLTRRRLNFRVEPPVHGIADTPCASCAGRTLAVRDGHVVQ
jgi:hypothetical protein